MYDTIHLWLDRDLVGNYNLSTIESRLNGLSYHTSDKFYFVNGSIKNMIVSIHETGMSIKGSLAKFYLGNNLETLSLSGTQRAIEQLSDELKLPVDKAKITRIDIATNFEMKYPPCNYYAYLGEKRYFSRLLATNDTLYYNTRNKKLVFYDKISEAEAKNVSIPPLYQNINLLRYELRYKGRLNKQFSLSEITGATLYNEKFYIDIINRWMKEYMNIEKVHRLTIRNINNMKTPNDAIEMIFGMLLLKTGQSEIDLIINDLKAKKAFADPKYYSRVKSKIKEIMNNPDISETSELIAELDQKIKSIGLDYC